MPYLCYILSMERLRTSSINKVLNRDPEVRGNVHRMFDTIFSDERLLPGERQKTKEETDIVRSISTLLQPFVERYGGVYVPYQPYHYRIFADPEIASPGVRNRYQEGANACYDRNIQSFAFFEPQLLKAGEGNLLYFAHLAVHESLHGQAFHSVQANDKTRKIDDMQTGLGISTVSAKDSASGLNEAVTEELKIRFMKENLDKIPHLNAFLQARRDLQKFLRKNNHPNAEDFAHFQIFSREIDGRKIFSPTGLVSPDGYESERQQMNGVIHEIVDRSVERREAEEVFTDFAKTYFTGNVKPLAHMIHENFGPGIMRQLTEWREGESMPPFH